MVQAESLALPDGGQYVGELKDGKPHGTGKCSWPDGSKYEGEWRAGVMHGRGKWIADDTRTVRPAGSYFSFVRSIFYVTLRNDNMLMMQFSGAYELAQHSYVGNFFKGVPEGKGRFVTKMSRGIDMLESACF
jgi:hypothetical protein